MQFTHESFSQKVLSNGPLTLPLSPEFGGEGRVRGIFSQLPFWKGGVGGFESYFLIKPEFSYFKYLKIPRTPVSTGVTTCYENI